MADVPSVVNYGQVVGRFVSFRADGADAGDAPDEIPLTGTVTLTPTVRRMRWPEAAPPRTAILERLTCPVIDGWLYAPGTEGPDLPDPGVYMIASEQPDGEPDFVQWRAEFTFPTAGAKIAPVTFDLPADGVVDLTTVIPVTPEPGTVVVVSSEDRIAAEQAAAEAAESATTARTTALTLAPLTSRWGFLGDSIVEQAYAEIDYGVGNRTGIDGWALWAGIASRGRISSAINLGRGGDTSQAMLDRWDQDVLPNANLFDVLCIQMSTNDGGQGVPLATSIANTTEMVDRAHALGKRVVLVGIGPNLTGDAARRDAQVLRNSWARGFAFERGIAFVDYYDLMVDPDTGGYLPGYSADGTHLTPVSIPIVGQRFLDEMLPLVPTGESYLTVDRFDASNLLVAAGKNPTFIEGTTAGVPESWTALGSSTGVTRTVLPPDDDSRGVGRWMRIEVAGTTADVFSSTGAARIPVVGGNLHEFTVALRSTFPNPGDGGAQIHIRWYDAADSELRRHYPLYRVSAPVSGILRYRVLPPAGATGCVIYLMVTAGTGSVEYALPTLRDLTALGLD